MTFKMKNSPFPKKDATTKEVKCSVCGFGKEAYYHKGVVGGHAFSPKKNK